MSHVEDIKKLQGEYQAARANSNAWMQRAKTALEARAQAQAPPSGAMERFAQNYGAKHIYTGRVTPLVHMMLIVGFSGVAVEYWCHHSKLDIFIEQSIREYDCLIVCFYDIRTRKKCQG